MKVFTLFVCCATACFATAPAAAQELTEAEKAFVRQNAEAIKNEMNSARVKRASKSAQSLRIISISKIQSSYTKCTSVW